MQITREDLNACTVRLNIVCEPQEVTEAFDKALKSIAKNVKVAGFRPGHAPKHMVEKMIDPNTLYEKAADELIRRTFSKAVEAEGLQPDNGTQPSVELKELDKDNAKAEYSAKVPLPPKIELAAYKGVEVSAPAVAVTDEEVDYQIDELRKRRGTREAVTDRGAVIGDIAVVNIKADGEEGEGRTFMTVVGQTFEGLDSALIGMAAEEMKHLELDFPANFQEQAWAGSKKSVRLTLNSVSAIQMPELDDEFAKALQTESVETLRATMRESILEAKKSMTRELLQDQILEDLRQKSKVEVSDNMWEALANQRLREISYEQSQRGKSMEDYAKENGMSIEELVKSWHDQAKVHVERAMVVREIFAKEKLRITNEELNQELFLMAREFNIEPGQLLQAMQKNGSLAELQFRAISRKVTDFLIDNAKISEGEAAEAKPAKTKAAKIEKPSDAEATDEKPKASKAKKKAE